jgi:hypothetical protein
VQVELVGDLGLLVDTGLDALPAADAEVLDDVPRLPPHGDVEVPHVAVDLCHL